MMTSFIEEIFLAVTDEHVGGAFLPINVVRVLTVFYDDLTITCFRLIGFQNVFKLSLTLPQFTYNLYSFTSQKNLHFFSMIRKNNVTTRLDILMLIILWVLLFMINMRDETSQSYF